MNIFAGIFRNQNTPLGVCPVGGVIGFLVSFVGVATLVAQGRNEWAAANGQTITDLESPLNGQTLPNLNASGGGTQRFLRGSTTSGATGGGDTTAYTPSGSICPNSTSTVVTPSGACPAVSTLNPSFGGCLCNVAILPSWYSLQWIIRFK